MCRMPEGTGSTCVDRKCPTHTPTSSHYRQERPQSPDNPRGVEDCLIKQFRKPKRLQGDDPGSRPGTMARADGLLKLSPRRCETMEFSVIRVPDTAARRARVEVSGTMLTPGPLARSVPRLREGAHCQPDIPTLGRVLHEGLHPHRTRGELVSPPPQQGGAGRPEGQPAPLSRWQRVRRESSTTPPRSAQRIPGGRLRASGSARTRRPAADRRRSSSACTG
jgi:hypothetical protein